MGQGIVPPKSELFSKTYAKAGDISLWRSFFDNPTDNPFSIFVIWVDSVIRHSNLKLEIFLELLIRVGLVQSGLVRSQKDRGIVGLDQRDNEMQVALRIMTSIYYLLPVTFVVIVNNPDWSSNLGPKTVKTGPKTDTGPVFARTDPTLLLIRTYFNEIFELILHNQNFIHNIGNLKLYINNYDENMDHVLQITHLHQNLKKILISNNYTSLYQSLLLSKDYNCSNTLNTITFYYINFRVIINLDKVFGQLNVLESVHIINCSSLEQIINLSKPFKLKSLILNKVLQFESLQQLLLKSGDYLENFGLGFSYGLSSRRITYKILDLIENIKQNLNYLSINIQEDNHLTNGSSIILKNLGQALPSKLEYLSLVLNVKESDFRAFLENSQDVFINKLLIKLQRGSDDISHYIKEYIMKGERVKYLVIKGIKNGNLLSDLKDEFKLYNIGVLSYNDLSISVNNFIKNNY
ncbi:unnamed protein product [Rhizophagus irregularis]|nr:unnamed protein product [Rhizophagus irregularis]